MAHHIGLSCRCECAEHAEAIASAIGPEVGAMDDGRSRTTLQRDAATLTLQIAADDITTLRAAMNSWCRLLSTASSVVG